MQQTDDPNSEIVKAFISALENREFDEASDYLSDNFACTGWTPLPLYKLSFLGTIKGLKEGIPGLVFNLHNVADTANQQVTGTIQVAGYQSNSFVLPALGTPVIPQMARSVSLPSEEVEFRLNDGKITLIRVEPVQGGGIRGLLEQLGIELRLAQ
ncbi:MAG TPA: hypothetical protein VL485_11395 [Ktedonobacteraceae bacterium]|jgi:hypothetical protein|nr:hypothetical protein [Ktedonobacteraceae bacterium]